MTLHLVPPVEERKPIELGQLVPGFGEIRPLTGPPDAGPAAPVSGTVRTVPDPSQSSTAVLAPPASAGPPMPAAPAQQPPEPSRPGGMQPFELPQPPQQAQGPGTPPHQQAPGSAETDVSTSRRLELRAWRRGEGVGETSVELRVELAAALLKLCRERSATLAELEEAYVWLRSLLADG